MLPACKYAQLVCFLFYLFTPIPSTSKYQSLPGGLANTNIKNEPGDQHESPMYG